MPGPDGGLPEMTGPARRTHPVSSVIQAARELFGNTSAQLPVADVWSLRHPVAYTLIWVGIILAVFVPLSTRQYKRTASR